MRASRMGGGNEDDAEEEEEGDNETVAQIGMQTNVSGEYCGVSFVVSIHPSSTVIEGGSAVDDKADVVGADAQEAL